MRISWWKIAAIILLIYTVVAGFFLPVPKLVILYQSIRNLYFHVPMWFSMMFLFGMALFYSIRYLQKQNEHDDIRASQFVNTGLLFAVLGLVTGSLWARATWTSYWVMEDPKLNGAAIVSLAYFAYIILRSSITDERTRARVSAVYNIFAAASIIPLLFIYPRMTSSLHPGNGGNPGFNTYELDYHLRIVFYPAVLGWTLLGYWMARQRIRVKELENEILENE